MLPGQRRRSSSADYYGVWRCVERNAGTARQKAKAKALIGLNFNDIYLSIVDKAEDAHAVWQALWDLYVAWTEARRTILLDDLQTADEAVLMLTIAEPW